jgi:hypothetical protein
MRKTQFSGLTVLSPDESVTSDNGAFIGRDRDTIDRFLQIGAKTHRHTGLPGLGNPVATMGASAVASGGTIQADQTFTLTYTLEDADGGETLVGPVVSFSTEPSVDAPGQSPDVEVVYENGGIFQVDTYYYAFAFVDEGGGETPIGPSKAVERQPGFTEAKAVLSGFTGPTTSAGAFGWRLYRAVGGGDFGYLTSGLASQNVFEDDGSLTANCDIPPLEEGTNSTNGESAFEIALPSGVAGEFINVYLTNGASFVGDALLEQFPVSSAGQKRQYTALSLLPGQPPDVNTSIGGAHQIDPDEELIDWHWKRPVAKTEDLPTKAEGSEDGDVRVVTDTGGLFVFNEETDEWTNIVGGAESSLAANGVGVVFFGEDLTKARPIGFKQIRWVGKAPPGEFPENMVEFDELVSLP